MSENSFSLKLSGNFCTVSVNLTVDGPREKAEKLIDDIYEKISEFINTVEPKLVDVNLIQLGPNKIAAIRVLREFVNLSLKDAKDLVESPTPLIIAKLEANKAIALSKSLNAVGCESSVGGKSLQAFQ